MHSELDQFKRLCQTLSQHRKLCTGEAIPLPDIGTWPQRVRTEEDFTALVSAAYKLWRENWKLDIGFFLSQPRADGLIHAFDQLIYHLRTAQQHTDNSDATARWNTWTSNACAKEAPVTADDWSACGRALMTEINNAVDGLCRWAAAGRQRQPFRQAWQAKTAESVAAAVSRVASDLGLYLNDGQRKYHVRTVEQRWSKYRLRPGDTAPGVLASLAERSLVSQLAALPFDYEWLLDELRVLGTTDAVPALRLAHAVAEISGTDGEKCLELVKSTWVTLRLDSTT